MVLGAAGGLVVSYWGFMTETAVPSETSVRSWPEALTYGPLAFPAPVAEKILGVPFGSSQSSVDCWGPEKAATGVSR